jgi:hypothetical protein
VIWIYVLPYFKGYEIRQELLLLSDETSKAHRLVKVPRAELEAWDREHDVLGQRIQSSGDSSQRSDNGEAIEIDKKEV